MGGGILCVEPQPRLNAGCPYTTLAPRICGRRRARATSNSFPDNTFEGDIGMAGISVTWQIYHRRIRAVLCDVGRAWRTLRHSSSSCGVRSCFRLCYIPAMGILVFGSLLLHAVCVRVFGKLLWLDHALISYVGCVACQILIAACCM